MITSNLIGHGIVQFVYRVWIGRDIGRLDLSGQGIGRFGFVATGQFLAAISLSSNNLYETVV
jgi:hypothetical protein